MQICLSAGYLLFEGTDHFIMPKLLGLTLHSSPFRLSRLMAVGTGKCWTNGSVFES
jgi:hypothetical protein